MGKIRKSIDTSQNFSAGEECNISSHNNVQIKRSKKKKRKRTHLEMQPFNINEQPSDNNDIINDPASLINDGSVKQEKLKRKHLKSSSSTLILSDKFSKDNEELQDLADEKKQSNKGNSKHTKRKRGISPGGAPEVISEEQRSLEKSSKRPDEEFFIPKKIKKSMSVESDVSEKISGIFTNDDGASHNYDSNKRLKKHKLKKKSILTEDSSMIISENYKIRHSNDAWRNQDVVIKEEFMSSYSDDEENIPNEEVTSNLEIKHFKKETESLSNFVDESLVEKLKTNKHNFGNSSSNSDTSSVEDSDESNFEEALLSCSNSQEKSQLVERKKLQKDREELTFWEIELLKGLIIVIPWPVPICHSIETRVSSYPTKQQKEQFAELEIKFAAGPYNKEEDTKIKENWSNFCESHGLEENPKLFLTFMWEGQAYLHKQQRINFVRYLAKDLEHRPLWSIYGRFQLLFSKTQKGNFTRKEDDIIMAFYENSDFPNKNSALAAVLNRTRASIKNRYNILKAEDSKTKFNDQLDQELVDNLMEVSEKNCILDLKDVQFDINKYKKISSKMNIHFTKLRRRWEQVLKPALFIHEYTFLQEIREKLIDLLIESKITDRREINWKQLAKQFDNVTSSKLYKMFTDVVCSYVPEHHHKSLPDIMNCLKHARNHMVNKKLKKFNYEGKKLVF